MPLIHYFGIYNVNCFSSYVKIEISVDKKIDLMKKNELHI